MNWQFSPYAVLFGVSAGLALSAAVVAWRRRVGAPGHELIWLLLCAAEWTLAGTLEIMATGLAAKVTWGKLTYIGTVCIPVLWLMFAVRYARQERWLTRRNLAFLWTLPVLTFIAAFTNDWHHWLWLHISLTTVDGWAMAVYTHGPWFWILLPYSYAAVAAGGYLILRAIWGSPQLYRRQAVAMLTATAIPWLANFLYITNLIPVPGLDITAIGFTFTGLIVLWNALRSELFDLIPIARAALIEKMSDGVVVLNVSNRILDMNQAARRLLHTGPNPIGQPAAAVLSHIPDLLAHLDDPLDLSGSLQLANNGAGSLDVRITPLAEPPDHVGGRLVVLRDVSSQRRAEEALRQAHRAAEAANQELACRLQELNAANADLQARNAELQAFAYTVAHDLKTPISGVLGYADLLYECYGQMPAEDIRASLLAVVRSSQKLNRIVDELLLLAQVRVAQVAIEPLDMGAILGEVRARLEPEISQAQAELVLPPAEVWPAALGYTPWVEEVWYNYISNALKYGGSPPRVELGAERPGDGTVRFWVRDNGRGVAPEEQARLFLPFERVGQARRPSHGLGLSIVRRIVERLGGAVGVESRAGQGSCFSFTLPECEPAAERD